MRFTPDASRQAVASNSAQASTPHRGSHLPLQSAGSRGAAIAARQPSALV